MRRLLVLSFLLLSLISVALAGDPEQDFQRGMAAIEMGNPARAYALWLPLAEAGHASAQFGLSMIFMDGAGVEQDFDEATYWLFKAADQNFAPAQYHLGRAYEQGISVKPDMQRAIHWWSLAAKQGLGTAQYRLARVYWDGEGVAADRQKARRLFRQARAHGEFIASEYRAALRPASSQASPLPTSQPETPGCSAWLAGLPQTGYTLQLVAGHQRASVTRFVEQHPLKERHAICAYRDHGKRWFGLFYGYFPDQATARQALKTLPAPLRASQPFPRPLATLRQQAGLLPPE